MNILIAILVFGIVVLVHEIGHFVAARACGVLVEEFSIGMGPRLLKFKRGETLYSLRLFPIGGSCQMLGEDEENHDERSFNSKKIWKRAVILSAGVLMNLLLAFLAFLVYTSANPFNVPVVRYVIPNSPAAAAGMQAGDRITKMNGHAINIQADSFLAMDGNHGEPIEVQFMRDGEKYAMTMTPILVINEKTEAKEYKIGVNWDARLGVFYRDAELEALASRATIGETVATAFHNVSFSLKATIQGLGKLITFKANPEELAGPIGIVSMVGDIQTEAVEEGGISLAVWSLINFMALLSANIGLFNLLPFPALDGGRLVFLVIEKIRRKPIPPEKEGMVHLAGLALLLVLAVFVAYNDILKLL